MLSESSNEAHFELSTIQFDSLVILLSLRLQLDYINSEENGIYYSSIQKNLKLYGIMEVVVNKQPNTLNLVKSSFG